MDKRKVRKLLRKIRRLELHKGAFIHGRTRAGFNTYGPRYYDIEKVNSVKFDAEALLREIDEGDKKNG